MQPSIFHFRGHWDKLIHRPASNDPVVDGVRAIAVLWVLVLHMAFFHFGTFTVEVFGIFTGAATAWIARGDLGVDLFFAISGYLMGGILLQEYIKTGGIRFNRFYARRFLRLIPVYTVVMLLGLYMLRNVPKSAVLMDIPASGNAENLWANVLYVNNFLPVAKQYMGWCWSLAIEEQFYLLLPFVLLAFLGPGRARLRYVAALYAILGVVQWGVCHWYGFVPPFLDTPDSASWQARFDIVYDKLHMRAGGLLAGLVCAYLTAYRRGAVQRFFARRKLVTAIAVVCLAVMASIATTSFASATFSRLPAWAGQLWLSHHRDVFSMAALFLILAATFTTDLFGGTLRRILAWRGFYPVAQLSYSIYLLHEMVFVWLFPKTAPLLAPVLGPWGTMAADSLFGLILILLIAVVLFVTVEKPCMELRSLPVIQNLGEPRRKAGLDAVT